MHIVATNGLNRGTSVLIELLYTDLKVDWKASASDPNSTTSIVSEYATYCIKTILSPQGRFPTFSYYRCAQGERIQIEI